ncbi:MAG: hypothetical protein ACO2ON_03995 [Candidatus Nanopusillus sp.]
MDEEQINKIEEILEKHLFETMNNSDYELKKMQVIILYLIYQKLKNINEKLDAIDQSLFEMANPDLYE